MPPKVILLSGPVGAGKSALASELAARFGCRTIKTHEIIEQRLGVKKERAELQEAGQTLDRETNGKWVADTLGRMAAQWGENELVVVDAVRIREQVQEVRRAFGFAVSHIHVTAPVEVLAQRYQTRHGVVQELDSYDAVRQNPTENRVEELTDIADAVIDTDRNSPADVLTRVASRLGMFGRSVERLVDVVVGGQYGSEGKGQVAAFLAREYDVLVRVGGPNAGHKVFAKPDPITFHTLPSGTQVAERARVILGPGTVLSLETLLDEIARCELDQSRLVIDPQVMLIESSDREAEAGTIAKTIGSTAQGVGYATARKVLRGAMPSPAAPVRLARDEVVLKPYVRPAREALDEAYAAGSPILLEGTQGTALSLHHGFYPHVTSRDTTVSGCLAEAGIAPSRVRRIIMVCRTYPIRVESPKEGDSGPMSLEIGWDEVSRRSGIPLEELAESEKTSTTKRKRRVGEFDWALLRTAASLNGPTDIALTFADYVSVRNRDARRFEQLTLPTINFIEEVERVARCPVSLIATRFHFRSIIDRREW